MPSPGSCHFAVCHPGMMKYIPPIMKTYFSNHSEFLEVSRSRSGADPLFPDHGAASGRRAEGEGGPRRADAGGGPLHGSGAGHRPPYRGDCGGAAAGGGVSGAFRGGRASADVRVHRTSSDEAKPPSKAAEPVTANCTGADRRDLPRTSASCAEGGSRRGACPPSRNSRPRGRPSPAASPGAATLPPRG